MPTLAEPFFSLSATERERRFKGSARVSMPAVVSVNHDFPIARKACRIAAHACTTTALHMTHGGAPPCNADARLAPRSTDQSKEQPAEAQECPEADDHDTRGRRVTTHPIQKDGPRECRQAGILNLGPEWLLSSRIRHFRRRERTTAISMVRNRCQLALVQGIYGLNKHRRGRSAGGAGVSS
jgi:hypothetical protein